MDLFIAAKENNLTKFISLKENGHDINSKQVFFFFFLKIY